GRSGGGGWGEAGRAPGLPEFRAAGEGDGHAGEEEEHRGAEASDELAVPEGAAGLVDRRRPGVDRVPEEHDGDREAARRVEVPASAGTLGHRALARDRAITGREREP